MTDFVQFDSTLGKKLLYTPCHRVEDFTAASLHTLINSMRQQMHGHGIGLAANQCGHALQLFMMEYSPDPGHIAFTPRYQSYRLNMPAIPFQVFINPRITRVAATSVHFWHGCLSALHSRRGKVATYTWIEYEAYNEQGDKISGRLDQFAAVIFQHEFRHLLGSLYLDHATEFKSHEELIDLFASGKELPYAPADLTVPHLLSDYQANESIEEYADRTR